MHRKYRVPRPVMWKLMLTLVLLGGAAATPAPAQPAHGRGLIVPINVTKTVAVQEGRLVRDVKVENPTVARVNVSVDARSVLITGTIAGTTKVRVTDTGGDVEIIDVVVQSDVEYLRYMLRQVVPAANVEPIPSANNQFILSGTVAKSEDIPVLMRTAESVVGPGNVIPAVRVGGVQQVQLDVCIARVQRTELRQMSFSWFVTGNGDFFGSTIGTRGAVQASTQLGVSAVNTLFNAIPTLVFGAVGDTGSFFGFLDALRQEGLAKLLACPKLVTMSGRPATFLSGGQIAVPQPSGLGTNAIQFKDFGTSLTFLPVVLGNGKIYLEVEPSVNLIDASNGTSINGTAVPGFNTQRVQTSVELEDGQTFAIGGLIQNTVDARTAKVPVVGDLPFLGVLFTSKRYDQREEELLILVTPHLVDAATHDQLPQLVPGQETRIPDDFELYIEGILEAPRGQREVFQNGRYVPAYKNGPTAAQYPCAGGCGGGFCAAEGGPAGPAGPAPLPGAPFAAPAAGAAHPPQALPAAPPAAAPAGQAVPGEPISYRVLPGDSENVRIYQTGHTAPPVVNVPAVDPGADAPAAPPVRTRALTPVGAARPAPR